MFSRSSWEVRYREGRDSLPWDSDLPAQELVEYFASLAEYPKHALEIGCGTGTNAIWMAEKGVDVVATDISPSAIKAAKEKSGNAKVNVNFVVADIIEEAPIIKSNFDFVFDRGVYHVMAPEDRKAFIDRVFSALNKDGYWLCLAGNADHKRAPGEPGPPQLKASDLIDNAEPKFEVQSLGRSHFILPGGKPHLAWTALFKKRAI